MDLTVMPVSEIINMLIDIKEYRLDIDEVIYLLKYASVNDTEDLWFIKEKLNEE